MHKPESLQENETHKILWDFEIQTDCQIFTKRPDPVLINKKKRTCHLVDFDIPGDHREEKRLTNTWILPDRCISCGT